MNQRLGSTLTRVTSSVALRLGQTFGHVTTLPRFRKVLGCATRRFSKHLSMEGIGASIPFRGQIVPLADNLKMNTLTVYINLSTVPMIK